MDPNKYSSIIAELEALINSLRQLMNYASYRPAIQKGFLSVLDLERQIIPNLWNIQHRSKVLFLQINLAEKNKREFLNHLERIHQKVVDENQKARMLGNYLTNIKVYDFISDLKILEYHLNKIKEEINKLVLQLQNQRKVETSIPISSQTLRSNILNFSSQKEIQVKKLDSEKARSIRNIRNNNQENIQKIDQTNSQQKTRESKQESQKKSSKKESISKKFKKLIKKFSKKDSKLFKIFSILVIIITAIILAYLINDLVLLIIISIIIFAVILIILSLLGRKSVSWTFSYLAVGVVLVLATYVIFHTNLSEFLSRFICAFMPPLCPGRVGRYTEKQIENIRLSIEETIKKITYIMQNPELAYIESKAEAEATREAYKYLFEIQSTNEVPINYIFYSKDEETKEIYSIPIYYAIRYALPVDREINITFNSYCLTKIPFKKECILTSTLSNLGTLVRYNRKDYFFNRDLNFHGPLKISDNYGMTSIKCVIPKFSVNISNCIELTFGPFYIDNLFLFLISNVTTRTVYKFLVIDESILIKSIVEGKDIYSYLKLNRYEYDKGYFEGFLDFPKINILRLGVLSEYPVIKFRNTSNISDFIYVSLSNIKEIYDIKKIEIEIIYNPEYLEIDLDPKFTGIQTQLYEFKCSKRRGSIYCNVTFQKFYDYFNRNLYIIYYKEHSDKLFFFIPIIISFSKNFTEYAEVIVSARAEYDIEKVESVELEYRMIEISI